MNINKYKFVIFVYVVSYKIVTIYNQIFILLLVKFIDFLLHEILMNKLYLINK